jgi:hypothetical protein
VQPPCEQVAQPRAAAHHEVAYVTVVDAPQRLDAVPRPAYVADLTQVRKPAGRQPRRATALTTEQQTDRFDRVEQERGRQHPQERDRGVRLHQHAHAPARRGTGDRGRRSRDDALFARGDAAVAHAGVGRDEHTCAREACPPAQIEIVGPGIGRDVEAVQFAEEVGPHEHRRVRHEEDVSDRVVLFLVDLVRFDRTERHAVVVDRHPDFEQDVGVVVVDELRADDAGVGAVGLLDHHSQRVGRERDVVVAEQQEGGALDGLERVVGGGRETLVGVEAPDVRMRHDGGDPRRRVLGGRIVQYEDRQGGVILRGEGSDRFLEPGTCVVGDDDRHHRRSGDDWLERFEKPWPAR